MKVFFIEFPAPLGLFRPDGGISGALSGCLDVRKIRKLSRICSHYFAFSVLFTSFLRAYIANIRTGKQAFRRRPFSGIHEGKAMTLPQTTDSPRISQGRSFAFPHSTVSCAMEKALFQAASPVEPHRRPDVAESPASLAQAGAGTAPAADSPALRPAAGSGEQAAALDLDRLTRPRALYEGIADSLRERIFSHELPPGRPIDEVELSLHYGVSRTPVREALKVLAHEGLLVMKPRYGCCVAALSRDDVGEILDVMQLMEVHAASLLAERLIHREPFAAAQALGDALRRLPCARRAVVESAGNRFLEKCHAILGKRLRLGLGPVLDEVGGNAELIRILPAALETEDGDRMVRLVAADSYRFREVVLACWKRLPDVAEEASSPAVEGGGG